MKQELKTAIVGIITALRNENIARADLFNKSASVQERVDAAWEDAKKAGIKSDQFRNAVNSAFNADPTWVANEGADAKAIKAAKEKSRARLGMAITRAFRKTGDAEKATSNKVTPTAAKTVTVERLAEIGKAVGLTRDQIKAMVALAIG